MRTLFPLVLFLCTFVLSANESVIIDKNPLALLPEQRVEIAQLASALFQESPSENLNLHPHVIKGVNREERFVTLEDESVWKIGWRYRNDLDDWNPGHHLRISHSSSMFNDTKLENLNLGMSVWASIANFPALEKSEYISAYSTYTFDPEDKSTLIVSDGALFKGPQVDWSVRDGIFVYFREGTTYDLWNLSTNEVVKNWTLIGNENDDLSESVLRLPKQLNKQVLGQKAAVDAVSAAIVNYWTGFKDPSKPVGVFLFLGPSGVGKTELARCLTDALFKSREYLSRFDMSHYNEPHSTASLIGAPPGYINHEEGGLLTNAIKDKPKSIILLDDFDEANPTVQKLFLPIFDEGFITDAKNRSYPCTDQLYILSTNICAHEITQLFERGLSAQEVLSYIEEEVISTLSPEIYNRVTPILFNNLTPTLMSDLVDMTLGKLSKRVKQVRNIQLVIDENAREYLIKHGFHPTLGARPLQRVMQEKIVTPLSYAMITERIPDQTIISIAYDTTEDSWSITWRPKS